MPKTIDQLKTPTLGQHTNNFQYIHIPGPGDRPGLTLWFSYATCVGFKKAGADAVVRYNDWGNTTGRHLNEIDGGGPTSKDRRVGAESFAWQLHSALKELYSD